MKSDSALHETKILGSFVGMALSGLMLIYVPGFNGKLVGGVSVPAYLSMGGA